MPSFAKISCSAAKSNKAREEIPTTKALSRSTGIERSRVLLGTSISIVCFTACPLPTSDDRRTQYWSWQTPQGRERGFCLDRSSTGPSPAWCPSRGSRQIVQLHRRRSHLAMDTSLSAHWYWPLVDTPYPYSN